MNKSGETIVIKADENKMLKGLYALGFEPKDVMNLLYQSIIVVCKSQGVDPAVQLMHLLVGTEEAKDEEQD